MYRRAFLAGLSACLASRPLAAQPPTDGRQLRIGVLTMRRPEDSSPQQAALIAGLREHGYIDGRNVVIDLPDVRGREGLLPDAVAGLVRRRADVILIVGPAPLEAARKATKSIPLVMVASSADPVADGVAASLARPGGNITGLAYAEPDRFKKQIELLQEAAPRVRRLTVLWDFDLEVFRRSWAAPLADAGRVLGIHVLDPMRVQDATELPAAFAAMKQQADAFLVASGSLLLPERRRVADLALQHRLPGIGAFRQFPQAGLLMSYGPDLVDINRRAGRFVDRILKGTPPGELAIELPSKFDLAINLATARTLGLAIPQPLLLRATEVIQ